MINRERSADLTKLDAKQADELSIQLGEKVRQMVDEAAGKINNLLKIYGMSAKFEVAIQGNNQQPAPKKRGRPKKQS